MAANNMRLRLVVRRHSLPDTRVLFSVPLDEDPTISMFLEQVNATIPLESNDWGLEDYTVELRGPDGVAFEALHFQPVASVLKQDEEVHIRPLLTPDLKKRRLSGRHQISGDGKHLIDGVPFGRPLLRQPRDRPAVQIPPRKRRRLLLHDDHDGPRQPGDDWDEDEEDDQDYQPLRLTEHGEPPSYLGLEDDEGADKEEEDYASAQDEDEDMDLDEQLSDIGEDELTALQLDNEEAGFQVASPPVERPPSLEPGEDGDIEVDEDTVIHHNTKSRTEVSSPQDRSSRPKRHLSAHSEDAEDDDLDLRDLMSSMAAAFPDASDSTIKRAFRWSRDPANGSVVARKIYKWLKRRYVPQMSYHRVKRHYRSRQKAEAESSPVRPTRAAADEAEKDDAGIDREHESESESVGSLVRYYDRHGFPPGSIGDGTALHHMADAVRHGRGPPSSEESDSDAGDSASYEEQESEADSEADESEDESARGSPAPAQSLSGSTAYESPSRSPTSRRANQHVGDNTSASEGEDDSASDQYNQSENDSEDESNDDGGDESEDSDDNDECVETAAQSQSPSSDEADSDEESSEDSSDTSDDDDAGEAATPADRPASATSDGTSSEDESSSNESDEDTSSSEEEDSDAGNLENSSDDSGSDSSSDEEPEEMSAKEPPSTRPGATSTTTAPPDSAAQQHESNGSIGGPRQGSTAVEQNEPGKNRLPHQGKARTRNRNARRRAQKKAARAAAALAETSLAASGSPTGHSLESRKQALLAALDGGPRTPAAMPDVAKPGAGLSLAQPSTVMTSPDAGSNPAAPGQHRTGNEVGPGRRMLCSSLGTNDPKSKEDEGSIRADLKENVPPHPDSRAVDAPAEDTHMTEGDNAEDADAWRAKVNYRAVECVDEGVELSEPPFPFVQRWDPQQRWQGRGGRSKRKQRDQAEFYQDENDGRSRRSSKKLKFADQAEGVVDELNYDEPATPPGGKGATDVANETSVADSQFTDFDDLPSLPADLNTLPLLRPGEVEKGMVITWKQWLLSEATSWQPQLVDFTAIVASVSSDGTGLRVVLAKRDRDFDANKKRYDEETGERVYGKFEVPDESGDEGEADGNGADDGWRTLDFASLIEPRLRQRPLNSLEDEGGEPASDATDVDNNLRTVDVATGSGVVTDSRARPAVDENAEAKSTSSGDLSTTVEAEHQGAAKVPDATAQARQDSIVPDSNQGPASGSASGHLPTQATSHEDIPMFDDDEPAPHNLPASKGDADNNVATQEFAVAPLEETPGKAIIDGADQDGLASDDAHSSLPGADIPSQQVEGDDSGLPRELSKERSNSPAFLPDHTTDAGGSQDITHPQLNVIPSSSAGSVRSGRQPDGDYDFDAGHDIFSNAGDTGDEGGVATPRASKTAAAAPEPQTPSKPEPDAVASAPSSSSSLPSISTLWHTCSTSRNTQSPSKAVVQSALKAKEQRAKGDAEYEEVMRRLDELGDDEDMCESAPGGEHGLPSVKMSDTQQPHQQSLHGSLLPPRQPAAIPSGTVKEEQIKTEPQTIDGSVSPPSHSMRGTIKGRQFGNKSKTGPPPDVEVIMLPSSPEPVYEEHYAEDDVDEDYEASAPGRKSSTQGSGWAISTRRTSAREPRSLRGVSVPAGAKSAVAMLGGGVSRFTRAASARLPSLAPLSSSQPQPQSSQGPQQQPGSS